MSIQSVKEELKKLNENIARLTSANDKLEKQIIGARKADKELKNRGRRKDDEG